MKGGKCVKRPAGAKGFESRRQCLSVAGAPRMLATVQPRNVAARRRELVSVIGSCPASVECSIFEFHELLRWFGPSRRVPASCACASLGGLQVVVSGEAAVSPRPVARGPDSWLCGLVPLTRLGSRVPKPGPKVQPGVAYPSLLTLQWLRCSPSGVVRVDGYVAARAQLGACSFGIASPAPSLVRGAGPRGRVRAARVPPGPGSGRPGVG